MAESSESNWIEHAIKRPGALREKTHTPSGKDISEKRLHAAEKSKNGSERKEAHLAEELEQFRHKK